MRYAAIDIGTVTCRLLVADVVGGRLHELHRGYGITNLGEGTDSSGILKPEAMRRVADQLVAFKQMIENFQIKGDPPITTTAVATSASRDAKNSEDFLNLLEGIGIRPLIISGEEEAALSFRGAGSAFSGEQILVVDIGGGSTEVIAGTAQEKPRFVHSFDIGCRRVTEKFLISDPPTTDELAKAEDWIVSGMEEYLGRIQESGFAIERLVAVAGTATSVVSIQKKLEVYDSRLVHRSIVDGQALDEVFEQLRSIGLGERRRVVGLDPDRAGVIVAGLLILKVVMRLAGRQSFTASESDILQGIILHTAAK